MNILLAIAVFLFLILLHEFGHFLAAKAVGIRVLEFSVGMGFPLIKKQIGETTYSLRIFPLGGFCQMEGEDEESSDERAFNSKGKLARFFVLVAGPLMNLLCGFLILVVLTAGSNLVGTTTVHSFREDATGAVLQDLQVGDQILAINGQRIHTPDDVSYYLYRYDGAESTLTVRRDGQKLQITGVQFPYIEIDESEVTGDSADAGTPYRAYYVGVYWLGEKPTVWNVLSSSYYQSVAMAKLIWQSLGDLIAGRVAITSLSGPVGVTGALGEAASQGSQALFLFIVFIAINLGVVNLLPLPALDGGRILFVAIETVIGRPVPRKLEGYVHFAGFALLMMLVVFVTYNDILRLIGR